MSSYKLYYFDARGVAEPIRLIFAFAKVPFEDVRFARGPEWLKLKPKMPWNVVPVLEVDGEQLSQSKAIVRFLGKRFGLTPEDHVQSAKCDEYIDAIVDLRTEGKKFYREQDPQKRSMLMDQFLGDHFLRYLRKFEEILAKSTSGHLVGSKLSYADIFVAYTVEQITSWIDIGSSPLDNYPKVKAHTGMVMSLPGIKEWVATRPKTKS